MSTTQLSFDDLGTPLQDVTFCVVDLETTGGSPASGAEITEIGAVKVRGGEIIGEFSTLVNPAGDIPPFITTLTGITNAMVADAPSIGEVFSSFMEFSHGCVMVAHNAPFDIGFLKDSARSLDFAWPKPVVIDTVKLARAALGRDEVPNMKLATLAARFSTVTPDHRALTDARATVDVLHALFERLGSLGVDSLEDLMTIGPSPNEAIRAKRSLADDLPQRPGVYLFVDSSDTILYVGTSKNLRKRVRSYFTRAEKRPRMNEMLNLAARVDHIECSSALEAHVRELRLIAHHRPAYNRRSKFPERHSWIKLTDETWPRFSCVSQVRDDGAHYFGPFNTRSKAREASSGAAEAYGLRKCTPKRGKAPDKNSCLWAQLGSCACGQADAESYRAVVEAAATDMATNASEFTAAVSLRMERLCRDEDFEGAAILRDQAATLLAGLDRTQMSTSLATCPELVVGRFEDDGWVVHVIRYGRLAAAGRLRRDQSPTQWLAALRATAETVEAPVAPATAALVEESRAILAWLQLDGIRVLAGSWHVPWPSVASHAKRFTEARSRDKLTP